MLKLIICFLISVKIYANSCKDILVNGIFNEYSRTESKLSYQALKHFACVDSGGEDGSSGNLGLKIIDVLVGNSGYNSKNEWYKRECSNLEELSGSSSLKHVYLKSASSAVLNAWKTCVSANNSGLVCYVKEYNKNQFALVINYAHILKSVENVKFYLVNFESLEDLSSIESISPGQTEEFFLFREDTSKASYVKIRGATEDYTVSCAHHVPAHFNTLDPNPEPEITTCATLYNDENYGSSRLSMKPGDEVENLYTIGLNDLFTSVRVTPSCVLEVFEHSNFSGRSESFTENYNTISNFGWSDIISSVKCSCDGQF